MSAPRTDAPRDPGALRSQGTRAAFTVEAHDKKSGPVTHQRVKKCVKWLGYRLEWSIAWSLGGIVK